MKIPDLKLMLAGILFMSGHVFGQTASLTASASRITTSTGQLTLTARADYAGLTPSAMGWLITLPSGWSMGALAGDVPNVTPAAGSTGTLEFAYSSFPTNAAQFTITLIYPAQSAGTVSVGSTFTYRSPLKTITPSSLSVTVAAPTPPSGPAITAVVPGHNQATVSFSPPSDNGGAAITLYTVTATPSGGSPTDSTLRPLTIPGEGRASPTAATVTATGTTSPITVTGLLDGTAYTFTVSATNSVGTGTSSSASAPATPTVTVPDAPTGVSATAGSGSAAVSFIAPANDGGASILSYTVTASPGGATATGSTSPITVNGLSSGTTYTFTVTATNSIGTSAASAASAGVALTAQGPVPGRLINLSSRAQVGTGDGILIAGFVVGGETPRTVLVRAAGPTLASYGVSGALMDPQLEITKSVNNATVVVASNDNWGGDAQITAVANTVGAFALSSASSKDVAILVTLPPGVYYAKASGVANTTGVALIEVYEVP